MTTKEAQIIQLVHSLNNPWIAVLLAVVGIWVISCKGIALWMAAKNNNKAWYIILLLVNTLGILEIAYIIFFSKKGNKSGSK